MEKEKYSFHKTSLFKSTSFSQLIFLFLFKKKGNDLKKNVGPTTSLSIRAAAISGGSSCSWYCLGFSTKERRITSLSTCYRSKINLGNETWKVARKECRLQKGTPTLDTKSKLLILYEWHTSLPPGTKKHLVRAAMLAFTL